MSDPFDIGDGVRVTATFTDLTGAAADPTTVVFKTKAPNGTVATISPTKQGIGVYYADMTMSMVGTWFYRWEGTGTVIAATEGRLAVKPSVFYQ